MGEVAHHGPEDLFIAIMTFIGAFLLMFSVHWQLALMTTIIVPFMTWLVSRYGARMTLNWRSLFRKVGDFNTRVQESVGGIRVVKAFANEDYESRLFARNNEDYKATKLNAYAYMTASIALSYFSTRLVQLVVMVAGTWFVVSGRADLWRLRQLPAPDQCLLPPDRQDHFGARNAIRRASPALNASCR